MVGFNVLLRAEGVDPAHVKLVRHQDMGSEGRLSPYKLWLVGDGRLELYQRIQRKPVFKGARFLASFVATPLNETLFVGLYENRGIGKAGPGTIDPISSKDVGGYNLYNLVLSPKLQNYRGRLIIEWGRGYRSWFQLARRKEKAIVEIRRVASERPFPGFLDFDARLSELASVPASWRAVLSAVAGIYLLINPKQVSNMSGLLKEWADSGGVGNNMLQRAMEVIGGCKKFLSPTIKLRCWK